METSSGARSTSRPRIFFSLLFFFLVLIGQRSHADPASTWRVGAPVVAYYNSPGPFSDGLPHPTAYWPQGYDPTELTQARAEEALAGGFNLVWINDVSQLPIAERYGLRAQLLISGNHPENELFFVPDTGWPAPENVQAINAIIDTFKASPAAYSYFIIDEPAAWRFEQLGRIVTYIRERDPSHLANIDLFPPDSSASTLGAADFETYLQSYLSVVQPQMLSYNDYNLMVGNDRSSFLGNLQQIAQAAQARDIPFMPILQGCAWGETWRVPNINELRFLSSSALAFGAKGIWYFNYWAWPGPSAGGIDADQQSQPTSVFTSLQSVNPAFLKLARKLQRLRWMSTYLKGYDPAHSPRYMTPVPASAPFDIPTVSNTHWYVDGEPLTGALIGYFAAGPGALASSTHALVANLDYANVRSYTVKGSSPMSAFDPLTAAWKAGSRVADGAGKYSINVTLAPGAAIIVAQTSVVADEAAMPVLIDSALQAP